MKYGELLFLLIFSLLFCACGRGDSAPAHQAGTAPSQTAPPAHSSRPGSTEHPAGDRGGHGPGGGMLAGPSNDEEAAAVLAACAPKFQQFSFTDPDTGFELEYSLYIPENWDGREQLPLVQFMPDSTGTGRSAKNLVENYYGAAIWASEEDQARHPAFVLVPAYTETLADDNWEVSDQLDTGVKLLRWLVEAYHLDEDRLYTTGQSGGCMASLYLSSVYPDLFAASLYVSGQWDEQVLGYLTGHSFFYITAGGDEKATGGQQEVMELLDRASVSYGYGEWDAGLSYDEQNARTQSLLEQGCCANFIRFTQGTVAGTGAASTSEHMASFNYAYKLQAVRDWLFRQSK